MKLVGVFDDKDRNDVFLWQVHDCLNWLVNKGYNKILNFMFFAPDKWIFVAESFIVNTPYKKVRGEGLTRRAACMATVLAVVKEEG